MSTGVRTAALVMVSVFLAFVLGDNLIVKMMGVGLATVVLVDATIARLMLVPAVMILLGKGNWWLPKWLERIIPHAHEPGSEPGEAWGTPAVARATRRPITRASPDVSGQPVATVDFVDATGVVLPIRG